MEVPLSALSPGTAKALKEAFDYTNPQFKKMERLGFWTGNTPRRIQNYEILEGPRGEELLVLPRGGTNKVRQVLRARGMEPYFEDWRLELEPVDFELLPGAVPPEPRSHQERIVAAALRQENALIRAATGSGKTEAALEFVRRVRQPAIVIVWTSGLMKQWIDRIVLRWGWPKKRIGQYGAGKKRIGQITVAMQQSLAQPGVSEELAKHFGVLVADEVQRFAAKTFREVICKFPARYRLGVSADERRKDRLDFLIRDHFGSVVEEISKDELIAKGQLCEVEIVVVPTDFHYQEVEEAAPEDRVEKLAEHYTRILDAMEVDVARNEMAIRIAAHEVRRRESSVLVFCERVDQARELARKIAIVEAVPCGLMLGQAKNREMFNDTKERLTSGELRCAVGSKAAYQGEDIPRLTTGVVVTPTGNNRQMLEQQVGRLRRPHAGKDLGRLYYLWDPDLYPNHLDNLRRWYGSSLVSVKELGEIVG